MTTTGTKSQQKQRADFQSFANFSVGNAAKNLRDETPPSSPKHKSHTPSPRSSDLNISIPELIPIPKRSSFNYANDLAERSPNSPQPEGRRRRKSSFSQEEYKHIMHLRTIADVAMAVEAFEDGLQRKKDRDSLNGLKAPHPTPAESFVESFTEA